MGLFGSILGGITGLAGAAVSAKASKKAANTQLQAQQQQIAATTANRDYQYGLNAPTIEAGNNATGTIQGLLNVGGDPAAAKTALDTFRASSGYQDLLSTGLAAVNSNAYARGLGNSGSALKALQAKGSSISDSSLQGYIGNLNNLASAGGNALNRVAGVGNNSTAMINDATQTGANAQNAGTLAGANNVNGTLQSLANLGASAFGSSYAPQTAQSSGIYANSPTLQGLVAPTAGQAARNPWAAW